MIGMDQGAEIGGQMAGDFAKECNEVEENIKWVNNSMSIIIYQEEIELLEEEKAELQQEVMVLRKRLKYYKKLVEQEEELNN